MKNRLLCRRNIRARHAWAEVIRAPGCFFCLCATTLRANRQALLPERRLP
jgi:hypothetical protein